MLLDENVILNKDEVVKCEYCDRNFSTDRIMRHKDICQRLASSAPRHHDVLRNANTSAKTYTPTLSKPVAALSNSLPASRTSPTRAVDKSSYVLCPNCGRLFEKRASERHMPVCAELNNKFTIRTGNKKFNTKLPKLETSITKSDVSVEDTAPRLDVPVPGHQDETRRLSADNIQKLDVSKSPASHIPLYRHRSPSPTKLPPL